MTTAAQDISITARSFSYNPKTRAFIGKLEDLTGDPTAPYPSEFDVIGAKHTIHFVRYDVIEDSKDNLLGIIYRASHMVDDGPRWISHDNPAFGVTVRIYHA